MAVHGDGQWLVGADQHQGGVEVFKRHQKRDDGGTDYGRAQVGQGDGPDCDPSRGTEVLRRFLEAAVEFAQACGDDQRSNGGDEGDWCNSI